MDKTNAACRL